jgi:ADP-L-glycero-D-manno-heptose 6-epimerase
MAAGSSNFRSYLVTGGAGFIGSHVVAALADRGDDVTVCDTLGTGDKWRNVAKHDLAGFVHPEALEAYLSADPPLDAIFHMGAISSTTETDGDLVLKSNFELSARLWQWCTERQVRLVYASSAATYGDGSAGFVDFDSPEELARLRPLNLYGWSKHQFDRWVARRVERGGPTPPQRVGVKFFNVYGPNEYHKGSMQSVVAHLYPKVARGEPARLFKSYRPEYPDGGQLRDFVYVRDCVDVMLWLADNPSISGLFNIGSGQARSFLNLAHATLAALGKQPHVEFVEMPETLRKKYQYFTQADLTRLRAAGYQKPMTTLEAGVGDYVQRYLATDDPYR